MADGNKKILLADDQLHLYRGTLRMLEAAGYEVATAHDGAEALRLLHGQTFDLVVSDQNMPNLTGLGLVRLLRLEGNDIPFILYSGEVGEEGERLILACREYRAEHCLKGNPGLMEKVAAMLAIRRP